jgi:hypothetical protein
MRQEEGLMVRVFQDTVSLEVTEAHSRLGTTAQKSASQRNRTYVCVGLVHQAIKYNNPELNFCVQRRTRKIAVSDY